jgi:hypothetical protein
MNPRRRRGLTLEEQDLGRAVSRLNARRQDACLGHNAAQHAHPVPDLLRLAERRVPARGLGVARLQPGRRRVDSASRDQPATRPLGPLPEFLNGPDLLVFLMVDEDGRATLERPRATLVELSPGGDRLGMKHGLGADKRTELNDGRVAHRRGCENRQT